MPSQPVHQTEQAFQTVSCISGLSSCTGTPHSWSWKAA
uniref:Uncharacterized protein n=1 Tax=Arundo donax TaxID=35708 RepID=A0A0A9DFN9_ARUDO